MATVLMSLGFAVLCVVFIVITKHFLNSLQNLPPCPFPSLPIIGHLHLIMGKPLHRALSKISDRHGPILLLHFGFRKVVHVSSPELAEEIYVKNDVVFANRPRLLAGKILGSNYTNLIWSPHGDHWKNLQKISAVEILSSYRIQTLSSVRSEEARLLIRRLMKESKSNDQTVDVGSAFFEFTMNATMKMISGKRFYGEEVEDSEEARTFREVVKETIEVGLASKLGDFLPLVGWIDGSEKKLVELKRKRDKLMQSLIDQNRETEINDKLMTYDTKLKRTMIQVLLSLQGGDPIYYSDEFIMDILLALLAGGADTSAATTQWALALLLNNPQVLKKAQAEMDNHVGMNRLISESDLAQLPYLHSIILETLRLYPVGPLAMPRASSADCIVGGYRIPRGTMLFVNIWAIHHDPNIWAEPNRFMPERFEGLGGTRDGFKFMPFGSGRRGCPGGSLAMRMAGLTLGSIIQCFEWERTGEEMVDMTEGPGLLLPRAHPLIAKCKPRPTIANLLSHV
ncbi:Cytochrome P450 [Dillenia turbinata]|uniref:Cytochrome P450 n=1 Tax=Dillenia turbinata TaxID=194707 RepID=A0AAN8VR30_9MAGN